MGLLFDEHPLVLSPTLAVELGNLNEAVFVQQLHYWIEIKKKTGKNYIDGCYWVFNSYEEWIKQFPWLSIPTLRRTIDSLVKKGYVIKANYNQKKMDHTTWYTLNYEKLMEIDKKTKEQKDEQAKIALEAAQKEEENKIPESLVSQETLRCDQNEQIDLSKSADRCDQNEQIDVIKMSRSMCSKRSDRCDQNDQSNTIDYPYINPETTSSETTGACAAVDEAEVVSEYNKLCPSFPEAIGLTPQRRRLIQALFADDISLSQIQEAFRKAEASDFLTGRSKDAEWNRFDFDWIIKQSSIISLLEGKYDNVAIQTQKRIDKFKASFVKANDDDDVSHKPLSLEQCSEFQDCFKEALIRHNCFPKNNSSQEARP